MRTAIFGREALDAGSFQPPAGTRSTAGALLVAVVVAVDPPASVFLLLLHAAKVASATNAARSRTALVFIGLPLECDPACRCRSSDDMPCSSAGKAIVVKRE